MNQTIFLVDMNAFFITCEMRRNPHLKGVPAAVAGDPTTRSGIILAANYDARSYGVKTTMTINQALKLCPSLTLVPPDHDYYKETSEKVMEYLSHFSPVIEQNSIDEAWIDMSGTENIFGSPKNAAEKIMKGLQDELDLWCSIGISSNKFLAKMASEMKKPLGITEIRIEDVEEILWPLPVSHMYGIGEKTSEALNKINIFTIGDLAQTRIDKLIRHFGKNAISMQNHALGIDNDPVTRRLPSDIKSIGKSVTLAKDITDIEEARLILKKLADEVSIRARAKNKKGHTVQITLKYTDFRSITRQCQTKETNVSKTIYEVGSKLLAEIWSSTKPIRLLGIALTDFDSQESSKQISLFDIGESELMHQDLHKKDERVQKAVDEIRGKFGKEMVSWASLVHKSGRKDKDK